MRARRFANGALRLDNVKVVRGCDTIVLYLFTLLQVFRLDENGLPTIAQPYIIKDSNRYTLIEMVVLSSLCALQLGGGVHAVGKHGIGPSHLQRISRAGTAATTPKAQREKAEAGRAHIGLSRYSRADIEVWCAARDDFSFKARFTFHFCCVLFCFFSFLFFFAIIIIFIYFLTDYAHSVRWRSTTLCNVFWLSVRRRTFSLCSTC